MAYDQYGNWSGVDTRMQPPYNPGYYYGPANTQNGGNYGYSNQLQQVQQQQQPQQPRPVPLNGKPIKDPSDIMPKEIPMDGSISFFPMQDLSYILAKAWNSQGTIDTVKYVPERPPQQDQQLSNEGVQQILDKLNKLEEIVGNLNKELNS